MAQVAPLDPITYEACFNAWERARAFGANPIEELHRAGLIVTPAGQRKTRIEIVNLLRGILGECKGHELLRRKFRSSAPCTPDDMLLCVLDFIREFRDVVAEGEN